MNSKKQLEVIRRVAAEIVAEIAPAEKRYFPVAWEEFLARVGGSIRVRKPGLIAGLFCDEHAELKLVSALTLCVVAEIYVELKYRFGPPEQMVMREATIAAAKRMGAPEKLAEALGERIPEKFRSAYGDAFLNAINEPKSHPASRGQETDQKIPECVAWFREPKEELLQRREGSKKQLEAQFFLQRRQFNIFVNCWENVIWVSNSEEPIKLERRMRKMLVLFLLRRGEPIKPHRMVRWAWMPGSAVIGAEATLIQSNLKVAVCPINAELKCVEGFKISEAEADGSYCCQGEFTFCILLPGEMDEKLASLSLRPRF
jgi:hypothetical protein